MQHKVSLRGLKRAWRACSRQATEGKYLRKGGAGFRHAAQAPRCLSLPPPGPASNACNATPSADKRAARGSRVRQLAPMPPCAARREAAQRAPRLRPVPGRVRWLSSVPSSRFGEPGLGARNLVVLSGLLQRPHLYLICKAGAVVILSVSFMSCGQRGQNEKDVYRCGLAHMG